MGKKNLKKITQIVHQLAVAAVDEKYINNNIVCFETRNSELFPTYHQLIEL